MRGFDPIFHFTLLKHRKLKRGLPSIVHRFLLRAGLVVWLKPRCTEGGLCGRGRTHWALGWVTIAQGFAGDALSLPHICRFIFIF